MFVISTRNFPPEIGGMQNLMGGLANALINHGPVKVFADKTENHESFDKYLKADMKKNLSLIDAIQNVRKSNNVNWMDILRLGMITSPRDAKNLIKKISSDDDEIGSLLRKIV